LLMDTILGWVFLLGFQTYRVWKISFPTLDFFEIGKFNRKFWGY
jgi:hypothetical protein